MQYPRNNTLLTVTMKTVHIVFATCNIFEGMEGSQCVIFVSFSASHFQQTTVDGPVSHALWDVRQKLRSGYRGKARSPARHGHFKIRVSQIFFGLLDLIFKFRITCISSWVSATNC